MREDAAPRWRSRLAVALLLLGLVVAFVPGLIAGDEFLWSTATRKVLFTNGKVVRTYVVDFATATPGPSGPTRIVGLSFLIYPTSLVELATTDIAWASSLVALGVAAGLFVWWRRTAIGFGRVVGIGSCAAAAVAVCALVLSRFDHEYVSPGWTWRTVPLGAALMAAAFVTAPAPPRRDDA